MRTRLVFSACLLAGAVALGGCNDVPVEGLEKSFSLKVRESTGTGDPVKIDFLWVVDNSASMCEEQVSLADNFGTFTDLLTEQFELDPRIAVTTMDMQCDPALPNIGAARGAFNTVPASGFPPSCQSRIVKPCTTNDDCAGLDCAEFGKCEDEGEWVCQKAQNASCVTNPNGSVNTRCRRKCATDEECQALFGNSRYVCQQPSTNPDDWGCMLPPRTEECPANVGPVLGPQDLDKFSCLATVGVNQAKCFKYEQGMASALASLDREGPNAASIGCTADQEANGECQQFLRDDAYLVIVFVTDEDDCSSVTPEAIGEDDHETCALLPTQAQGGPLVPVNHYVNRFKSLKSDPARVIVASIAGNAPVPDDLMAELQAVLQVLESDEATDEEKEAAEAQRQVIQEDIEAAQGEEQAAYVESKSNPFVCYQTTKICLSPTGQADWGARYFDLSDRFGQNGVSTNICSAEGIGPALEQIGNQIIRVVSQVCLPRPVLDMETLEVRKTVIDPATGQPVVDPQTGEPETMLLTRVDDQPTEGTTEYRIGPGGEDCEQKITFGDPPGPGEEVIIEYKGDPGFGQ